MVAALILFNRFTARYLGAGLSISQDPCHVFALSVVFGLPGFSSFTINWFMRFLAAVDTKSGTTLTFNWIFNLLKWVNHYAEVTLKLRAPFNILIIVGKALAEPFPVHINSCLLIIVVMLKSFHVNIFQGL
jgi:hypothetical protein